MSIYPLMRFITHKRESADTLDEHEINDCRECDAAEDTDFPFQ